MHTAYVFTRRGVVISTKDNTGSSVIIRSKYDNNIIKDRDEIVYQQVREHFKPGFHKQSAEDSFDLRNDSTDDTRIAKMRSCVFDNKVSDPILSLYVVRFPIFFHILPYWWFSDERRFGNTNSQWLCLIKYELMKNTNKKTYLRVITYQHFQNNKQCIFQFGHVVSHLNRLRTRNTTFAQRTLHVIYSEVTDIFVQTNENPLLILQYKGTVGK